MRTVSVILEKKPGQVATITPDATAQEAAQRMNELRIGSLVVSNGLEVLGIVTERDILRRLVAAEREPGKTHVRQIMTEKIAFCHPSTTLDECKAVMTDLRIRHLPVLDEGRLVGMVTIGDLLAQEIAAHQHTIEYLNAYMEMPPIPHG
jgi:CBS domain-containing protein